MRVTTALATTGLAAVLAVGSITAANADTTSPAPTASSGSTGPAQAALRGRLKRACERVPKAITRTENLQTRLAADAATRGSLAWLKAKADQADAAGHHDLADVLRARLAIRTDRAGILPDRITQLKKIEDICAEHGEGAAQ